MQSFADRHCIPLHYCWPTRALNRFCATNFINLPSLHGWQMLLQRTPRSQGKQLAGSCLPASQELEQWAWGWGPESSQEATEHAGLGRGQREPVGPAVHGVVILRCGVKGALGPWEPQCSGCVEHASKRSRSRGRPGKLEGTHPYHEPTARKSLPTPGRLASPSPF